MKTRKLKKSFWAGIVILAFLIISYFIKIEVDSGANYQTLDTLLGIIIFHNIFVFGIYVLIAGFLIFKGLRK